MISDVGLRLEKRGARPRCGLWNAGFTLLETLIVVAILGLMLVIAVPWFQRIRQRYLVKSAAFEIQSSLLAARMRAVKRNGQVSVVITPATPGQPAHEIDVIEPLPATNSTSLISAKSVDLAIPSGNTVTFKGDGSVVVPPPPGATIVVSGPPGAIAPNQITIEAFVNGRVQVKLPTNWN